MRHSMLLVGLLATIVNADGHRLCACQAATDGEIDDKRTQQVVNDSKGYLIYSNYYWKPSDGAHYAGSYFHAIDGSGRWGNVQAKGNGWMSGKDVYNRCRDAGAADSTCFNTKSYQRCGDGQDGCFNTYGSTDGNGKIVN